MTTNASPFPNLLDKVQVQQLLDISDRTLEKMVRARSFPPPLRLGKTVRWAESVVKRWLETRLAAQMAWEPKKRTSRSNPDSQKA